MLVKFNLQTGDTVTLVARDRKGNETDDVRDAIHCFNKLVGQPFELASVAEERKAAISLAPISPEREAQIRDMFPSLFPVN